MQRETVWQAAWRANRKLPLLLLGLLLLNLVAYFMPLQWLARDADETQREFIRLQSEERGPGRGGVLTPAEAYARAVDDLQRFRAAIPDQKELSGLVDELFRLAERSGLTISRVQYSAKADIGQQLLHYEIRFEVSGSYDQVRKLVHAVEQSPRLLTIDALALGGGRSEGNVSLRLQLTTFFRTDGHEPAA
jgi:type IV pilus assembly protein PilO